MAEPGGQFAAIPKRALHDKRLYEAHFRVLGIVALYDGRSSTRGGKGCFRSQRDMAAEVGIDFGNFSRALKELGVWGYVQRERNPRNKRQWIYRVTYTGRQIIQAVSKEIVGPRANEIVGPHANDQSEIVGPRANISLYFSEKNSNGDNDLTPLLDPTRSLLGEESQEGSALPLPRKGEASAAPEKKEGLQVGALGEPSRSTDAEREAHVAEVERRLGRAFGSKR
jgi:DNA-binding MarR family transcriptional regulator